LEGDFGFAKNVLYRAYPSLISTPLNRTLLEKLIVVQLIKNFSAF
jgi:hypothetical protein